MLRTLKLLQDSLLDRIMDRGTGTIVYLSCMDSRSTTELISALGQDGRPRPEIWDIQESFHLPYPPFLCLLGTKGSEKSIFTYHRHTQLFPVSPTSGEEETQEDLILDEIYFERKTLETALAKALGRRLKSANRLMVLRNAHLLPPESLDLLQRTGFWEDLPLVVLVVKEGGIPTGAGWSRSRDFWIRKESSGEVIKLFTDESNSLPDLPPVPGVSAVSRLSSWLCFEHALILGEKLLTDQGRGEERLQVLLELAKAQSALENWDQAIPLLEEVLEYPFQGRLRAQLLLAQSWREKNDRPSALRTVQAILSESQEISAQDKIRLHMICRRLGLTPDENFRARLPDEKEILELCRAHDWENHRAFILSQNNAVETAWTPEEARRIRIQLEEGVALCRRLNNRRRLASALHALGHMMMKSGDFKGAARIYRQALAGYRKYTSSMVLARMLNGFGYLHFTMGQYSPSLKMHAQALALLEGSRYYEELLTTMVNMSRVYHFTGKGTQAAELLSSVFQLMGSLPDLTLPFISSQTLLANLGLSALDARRYSQAVEISRRLEEHFRKNPDREVTEYSRLFFTRRATLKDRPEEIRGLFQETARWLEEKIPNQVHLKMYLYHHWALWEAERSPEEARALALRALTFSMEPTHFSWEKARFKGLVSGKLPPPPKLPDINPDYRLLKELMGMDGVLLQLHRKIRDMAFIQRWQQQLVGNLFSQDHPGNLAEQVKEQWGLESAHFTKVENSAPGGGTHTPKEVVLPLKSQDKTYGLFRFTASPGQVLTPEDFKIFQLAVGGLSLVLVAQEKNRLLEVQKQKLENSNLDLEITLGNLKAAQNQLVESEKLAALGGLVAGVAHEINTPLGVALTGVTFLREKTLRLWDHMKEGTLKKSELEESLATLDESAEMVTSNLERAAMLIQSFKQVAVDQSTEFRRKFNLKQYVGEILKSLSPKWKHTSVKVTLDGQEDIEMDSYPGAIAQIVTNLISNSLVHGFPDGMGGEIHLLTNRTPSGEALLIHQDNGQGIPPENMGKIFHPFFTTSRGRGGTGLGLHIVYNLVTQKLGGRIRVESTPGSGTVFYLTLPMEQQGL